MKFKLLFTTLLLVLTQPIFASNAIQNTSASFVISDYAKTKYPIVLAHGLFGFNKLGSDTLG